MKLYIYSGTHWDREWYQCFQGFRYRLVEMADNLVDGLERCPDYNVFHFDGQTIVLEDILEIAPDLEDKLAKFIQNGKIKIGPWYCMPDEFLVSGESLIRNLQMGHEISRKWGVEPSKDGYICDIFGHAAQVPQIFDGMDIHHTVLGRGTNERNTPMHFRWQSPDGTDVRAYKLPTIGGYGDFTEVVGTTGLAAGSTVEQCMEKAKGHVARRMEKANIPVVLFLDALDHNQWHEDTPKYVEALKRLHPDAEVYHTDIMDFCRAVDEYIDEIPFKQGELNEPQQTMSGFSQLITNVLSSRYDLKKANDINQNRLEKIVQPLNAYGKSSSRPGFLKLAQKYLIMNHPHDSICGCSIDQVHRDMKYRFDQTRLICDEIMSRVIGKMRAGGLDTAVSTAEDSRDSKILRIYNPLPYRMRRTIETEIRFPKDYRKYYEQFGYEGICAFKLFDADGNEIPYGIKDIVIHGGHDSYFLTIEADLLPSGITDIEVRPSDLPTRYLGMLSKDTYTAENEYMILRVNPADGSVSVTDKANGKVYPSLLNLVDNGDIGDGWYTAAPKIDRTVTGTFVSAEKCENNINSVTFKINVNLRLPTYCERHNFGTRRAEETVDCPVTHYITMRKGEKALEVKTIVDNKACDHRLKLRLGTAVEGKTYYASQAFAMVERTTDLIENTGDWMESAIAEKATEGIVAKYGEVGGFAFMSKYGLHECAVYEDGNIDITLMRCFRKTVGTEGEIDGQLLGVHEFEYMLMPIAKDTESLADLAKKNDVFRAGILDTTIEAKTGIKYAGGLELKNPNFVFSTANKLDDGMEFRFYNCSDNEESGEIVLPAGAKTAAMTYIDGRKIAALDVVDGKTTVTAGKWKIVTVKVTF